MTLSTILSTQQPILIADHVDGAAVTRVYLDGRAAPRPILTACHTDREGCWFETRSARRLLEARNDTEFTAIAAAIRFPSSHPVAPNRYNDLVAAAPELFA